MYAGEIILFLGLIIALISALLLIYGNKEWYVWAALFGGFIIGFLGAIFWAYQHGKTKEKAENVKKIKK